MHNYIKIILITLVIFISVTDIFSQDTNVTRRRLKNFSSSGIFISAGTGMHFPISDFNNYSSPNIGILGRIELGSTSLFPFVPGAEVSYFSHNSREEFRTLNNLINYRTKVFGAGLSVEYALSRLLKITYAIPFLTLDVKYNQIKREAEPEGEVQGLKSKENQVSAGLGIGITLFIIDVYAKYNYMKGMNHIGAYTKVRIPVIRF